MNSGNEFDFITELRRRLPEFRFLMVGAGDDTAVLRRADGTKWLYTTDMLLEGVHFDLTTMSPRDVGRKALAVNLSDIAAMGGTPTAAVVSVALPRRGAEFARELHEGIIALARDMSVAVAGGDTNAWDGPLVVNIALTGEAPSGGPITRSNARVGDWIMSTGPFGGSRDGHHYQFTPRVREARALLERTPVHAMIDVSDGLAADLHHILTESHVGAVLREVDIPVSSRLSDTDTDDMLQHALTDGEDFELLFTVDPVAGADLLARPPAEVNLFHFGEITESGCYLLRENGATQPLANQGWIHRLS